MKYWDELLKDYEKYKNKDPARGPEIINAFNLAVGNTKPLAEIDKFMGEGQLSVDLDTIWEEEVELKARNQSLSFRKYYDFLEKNSIHKPSNAEVKAGEECLVLAPLKEPTPEWWSTYNGLKHDKQNNLKKATVFATTMGLSALFWTLDCCVEDRHIEADAHSKIFLRKSRVKLDNCLHLEFEVIDTLGS